MANKEQLTEIKDILSPKTVAIPLASTNSKYYDLFVEIGDEVKLGQKIAERYGTQRTPIFSSVSGKVEDIKWMEVYSGIKVDHLVIKNDFHEEAVEFEPLKGELTAKNIQRQLAKFGVRGLDQSGLYTRFDFTRTIKHVIVNDVFQNQAFLGLEGDLFYDEMDEIIEGLKLMQIASLSKVTVLCESNENAVMFKDAGFDVVMVKPKVSKAWLYNAIKKIVKVNPPFDLMDIGVLFTPVHSAKAVYDAVVLGKPVTDTRMIMMCHDNAYSQAFQVKIGTHISNIMMEIGTEGNLPTGGTYYTGSVLNGFSMKSDNFAVNEHISSIGVAFKEENEEVCIKCGMCNDICPVHILPQNIMDAEIRMIEDRMYEYDIHTCVECGLCSYTCPSEINVLEWIRRAKRRVSRG